MGLTFKRQDELEKMLDKFAVVPNDPKKDKKKKPVKDTDSDKKDK